MSKTFVYTLIVIVVYVVIIFPKVSKSETSKKEEKETEKADTKSGSGLSENADENGISQGASGQQKYRIGWTN